MHVCYRILYFSYLTCVIILITFLCRDSEGGIPARTSDGKRVLLFVGIIDILQSYRLKKKLEHTFKSIYADKV